MFLVNGEKVSEFRLWLWLWGYTSRPSKVLAYLVDTGSYLRVGKKYLRYVS